MENHDCVEIIFNSKYWRYKINLRGFLMCIFVLASSSKQNTKMLHDIISSKSILQIAPFLMHYKDFEKVGFNVILALREIAYKFQHELDYNSQLQIHVKDKNSYLLYKVTETYFAMIQSYFNFVRQMLMDAIALSGRKIGLQEYADIRHKINEYRLNMLALLKKGTEDQLGYINRNIDYYHMEYKRQ